MIVILAGLAHVAVIARITGFIHILPDSQNHRNRFARQHQAIFGQLDIDLDTIQQRKYLWLTNAYRPINHAGTERHGDLQPLFGGPVFKILADFIGQCTFIDGKISSIGDDINVQIPNNQTIAGHGTIEGYPFAEGEVVKCAMRPEDLHLSRSNPDDNEISGTVTRTIYVGNSLEVYFNVGDISAQAMLDPDSKLTIGDSINLYAQRDEVMVLPLGGVEALRKVPGHPLFEAPEPSSSVPGASE